MREARGRDDWKKGSQLWTGERRDWLEGGARVRGERSWRDECDAKEGVKNRERGGKLD